MERIFAIKGGKEADRAIITKPTKNNKMKILLYTIGVNHAKGRVMSRLQITEPGPRYCHFPLDREKEYFSQLLAEKAVTKVSKGISSKVWVKTRNRNEALDLAVYNLAALYISGADLDALAEEVRLMNEPPPPEEERPGGGWIERKEGWLKRGVNNKN